MIPLSVKDVSRGPKAARCKLSAMMMQRKMGKRRRRHQKISKQEKNTTGGRKISRASPPLTPARVSFSPVPFSFIPPVLCTNRRFVPITSFSSQYPILSLICFPFIPLDIIRAAFVRSICWNYWKLEEHYAIEPVCWLVAERSYITILWKTK